MNSSLYWYNYHKNKKLIQGEPPKTPSEQIAQLFEQTLQSTTLTVENTILRQLSSLLSQNTHVINDFYLLTSKYFNKKSNRTKLLILSIVDFVFCKSNAFRLIFSQKIYSIFSRILSFKREKFKLLPLFTAKFFTLIITTLVKWEDSYAPGYKQLRLGLDCLKREYGQNYELVHKIINSNNSTRKFKNNILANGIKPKILYSIVDRRLQAISFDINSKKLEIVPIIHVMENLFTIILESNCRSETIENSSDVSYIDKIFSDIFKMQYNNLLSNDFSYQNNKIPFDTMEDDSDMDEILELIQPSKQNTLVVLDPTNTFEIQKTRDNFILFDTLSENFKILQKRYFPIVDYWITSISRLSSLEDSGELFAKAISVKALLDAVRIKYNKIGGEKALETFDSDDESDGFENVEGQSNLNDIEADLAFEGIYSESEESSNELENQKSKTGFQLPRLEKKSKKIQKKTTAVKSFESVCTDKETKDLNPNISHIKWAEMQKDVESIGMSQNTSKKPSNQLKRKPEPSSMQNIQNTKKKSARDNGKSRETGYSRLNKIVGKRFR
ncbi:hypothetical protein BB561_004022 [Smittium simulii]|uniref:Uncharacterized protein n=1 Tax=Smittium simulii TaxID=133385 RepID=A0A2T9YIF7_9FUNG|nr:hypothetical protein BB561_004022 [Smittium simulii]